MKIKTIDITAKEWFDKINGNSYFSAIVTLNYGMEDQTSFGIPFEYGYGDYYKQEAKNQLEKRGFLGTDKNVQLWQFCKQNKIIVRTQKHENCLKKTVIQWGN